MIDGIEEKITSAIELLQHEGHDTWRPFYEVHRLQTSAWERTVEIPASSGPESGRALAAAPSLHLLRRFGWAGASEQVVQAVQDAAFGPTS